MNTTPHPFYHPTTIAVIDDSMDFMINFSLQLDDHQAYTLHSSPLDALNHLNSLQQTTPLVQKYMTMRVDLIKNETKDNIIILETSKILSEINNAKRFQENSVVIVDYAMPHMNGIEFCKLLNNKSIKKILLTGVADEKTAIQAFNDGVIDKFIKKNDDNNTRQINRYISEFQNQYFQEKTALIKNTLNFNIYGFLMQPHFIETFNQICRQYNIVEYYLTHNQSGYLLIDANNKIYHLIVLSENELKSHADTIKDHGGPQELYNLVHKKEAIPNFLPISDYYTKKVGDWRKHTFPASPLFSSPTYYFTVIESPTYYQELITGTCSYANYLSSLDERLLN